MFKKKLYDLEGQKKTEAYERRGQLESTWLPYDGLSGKMGTCSAQF